jgi:hypothetical protein
MINNIIIISEESIDKSLLIENLIECKILPEKNIKLPIIIKLGNYENTKLIYKGISYLLDIKNILPKLNDIINSLSNNIHFEEIIIETQFSYNINYYILPSYQLDDISFEIIDSKILALYDKYLLLNDSLIINIIPALNSIDILNGSIKITNSYYKEQDTILIFLFDINIEANNFFSLDLYNYKKYFNIKSKNTFTNNKLEFATYMNIKKFIDNITNTNNLINNITNKLYLDLNTFEVNPDILNYDEFYNSIYNPSRYRHHFYYQNLNDINANYEEKKIESKNANLLEEYKDYEFIINQAIDKFDIIFSSNLKKLEPEILKYYVTLYYNKNYDEEFELTEDYKFNLMLKGLRKMCIALVKKELQYLL